MGVASERHVTLESGESGKLIGYQIESGEAGTITKAWDHVTMTCDFSGCKKSLWQPGQERGPKVLIIDDPAYAPDDCRTVITMIDWDSNRRVVCSKDCAIGYLQLDYKAPQFRVCDPAKEIHLVPPHGYLDLSSSSQSPDGVVGVPA